MMQPVFGLKVRGEGIEAEAKGIKRSRETV
jgi:hypothetical protein